MKIIEIKEKTFSISSEIKNAYISFAKMDCSVVALKSDVKINGENVVGYGFHSNGRYAVSELLKKRFIPRLNEAEEKDLINDEGTNFSPEKIWKILMQNEKPGGHGERSTAVGTIDMAVWDLVSKIEQVPLYEYLANKYGNGKYTNKIFVYAAGGYYYPGKDIPMLRHTYSASPPFYREHALYFEVLCKSPHPLSTLPCSYSYCFFTLFEDA